MTLEVFPNLSDSLKCSLGALSMEGGDRQPEVNV